MSQNYSTDPSLLQKMSSEVAPEISPLMRLLLDNARRIIVILAVCVLGAAGYGIYTWHAAKQVAEAQNELGKILVIEDTTARMAKLKTFLTSAPAGIKPAVTLAIARTAMLGNDYAEAEKAWSELAGDTKDPLYVTAVIGKAESMAAQNKDSEALAVLETMALPADSAASLLVSSLIVNFAEKSGNLEKAVAACEKVASSAMVTPDEAEFWRQKAAYLRGKTETPKS